MLLAVDDDPAALERTAGELRRRYGSDYRVIAADDPAQALSELEAMRVREDAVAVVLADQWMPGRTGAELLARTAQLHPHAKRGLLVDWGAWADRATADAIHRAMALGEIHYYVLKPWRSPDEFFHRTVTEWLHEWHRTVRATPQEVVVVGEQWSPRSHELRSLLVRNGVPHAFHASDSEEGRRVLSAAGQPDASAPVVVLLDGQVLVDPSNAELARAYGVRTELEDDEAYDVAIVGAGPAGLAAAVYGSSEGLRTLVVEREALGGQAGSSSLIRNYLGFARGISGAELAQRAYQQAWVFGASFLLMREVVALRPDGDGYLLATSAGREARARAVVLATGVSYRRVGVPALEALTGAGVFYGASVSEAQAVSGRPVYVVGGGNSAGQAAMHLSGYASSVTLLVRGGSLAESMSSYLRGEIAAAANIEVRTNSEVVDGGGGGRLEWLTLRDRRSGETSTVPAAGLFVLIGAVPHTDWLPAELQRDRWGYVATGAALQSWPLERPPSVYETSLPGVFAVGDVRERSLKRVASAVGEGSVVIRQVYDYLRSTEPAADAATAPAAERSS